MSTSFGASSTRSLATYQAAQMYGIATCSGLMQVNGEFFGHGTMSMNLDPSQHHHLHNHHASMAAMQMPLNPGDGMM